MAARAGASARRAVLSVAACVGERHPARGAGDQGSRSDLTASYFLTVLLIGRWIDLADFDDRRCGTWTVGRDAGGGAGLKAGLNAGVDRRAGAKERGAIRLGRTAGGERVTGGRRGAVYFGVKFERRGDGRNAGTFGWVKARVVRGDGFTFTVPGSRAGTLAGTGSSRPAGRAEGVTVTLGGERGVWIWTVGGVGRRVLVTVSLRG